MLRLADGLGARGRGCVRRHAGVRWQRARHALRQRRNALRRARQQEGKARCAEIAARMAPFTCACQQQLAGGWCRRRGTQGRGRLSGLKEGEAGSPCGTPSLNTLSTHPSHSAGLIQA
jgi:hypothetical protein